MTKKYVKYTHPAAREYSPNVSYDYESILEEIGVKDAKIFFTPINFKWDDLNVKQAAINTKKIVADKKDDSKAD